MFTKSLKDFREEYAKSVGYRDFQGMITMKGYTTEDSEKITEQYTNYCLAEATKELKQQEPVKINRIYKFEDVEDQNLPIMLVKNKHLNHFANVLMVMSNEVNQFADAGKSMDAQDFMEEHMA